MNNRNFGGGLNNPTTGVNSFSLFNDLRDLLSFGVNTGARGIGFVGASVHAGAKAINNQEGNIIADIRDETPGGNFQRGAQVFNDLIGSKDIKTDTFQSNSNKGEK